MFVDENIFIFDTGNHEWQYMEEVGADTDGSAVVHHETKIYCFDWYGGLAMRVFDTQVNDWTEIKRLDYDRTRGCRSSFTGRVHLRDRRTERTWRN